MEDPTIHFNTDSDSTATQPKRLSGGKSIFTLILISLLAGMGGGLYGALNLANRPGVQKFFNSSRVASNSAGILNQNIVVNEESAITKVVEQASPAVVSIVVSKELSRSRGFRFDPSGGFRFESPDTTGEVQQIGAGTGFFVSADGLILTNKHVVSDATATYSVLTSEGKSYDAKVLSRDPVNDLAIVKVDMSNAKYLTFADSAEIELGQYVVAIGNSLGQYQNTVTSGIVSGVGRSIVAGDRTGSEQLEGVIQTDAAINPGNSGGPLLNLAGQVIGINTAVDQGGQLVGFAIPANDAKVSLESYQKNGKIVRPYLGVRYMTITTAVAEQEKLARKNGALIIAGTSSADVAVLPGSPADKAGIRAGDIIVSLQGQALNEKNTLSRAMKLFQAGQSISVVVFRDGREQTVPVVLGEAQ